MTTPVVYFIDDSATMREVIKIAFRRESIEVVAFSDADSAMRQMFQQPADIVISDLIMPGRDGYDVCRAIKENPATSNVPVVLMSGVVNKGVAEKAFAVKADELIRKPFQPGDLLARVKQLMASSGRIQHSPVQTAVAPAPAIAESQALRACAQAAGAVATLSSIFSAPAGTNGHSTNGGGNPQRFGTNPAFVAGDVSVASRPSRIATPSQDVTKLRIEILRLEHLVKKLQSEIAAEREYAQALEEHIKTLQETD